MENVFGKLSELRGLELGAKDGHIGRCQDFLFDDQTWTVRYIVADTRKWLPGRKVLISPISIESIDTELKLLNVELTKEEIKGAPPLESDLPVSRRYEILFSKYYDWAPYWGGGYAWGEHPYPRLLRRPEKLNEQLEFPEEQTHLRSANEVMRYDFEARGKGIGYVEDMILEEESWIIRYLVIDTSNWIPGSKRVLFPPDWVEEVDWGRSQLEVALNAEQIKNSPEYDPDKPLLRSYEKMLFDHYGKHYYW